MAANWFVRLTSSANTWALRDGQDTVSTDFTSTYTLGEFGSIDGGGSLPGTVEASFAAAWNVLTSASADKAAIYQIIVAAQADFAAQYQLLAPVTQDYTVTWQVETTPLSVAQNFDLTWGVLGAVQRDASGAYDVLGSVSSDLLASWHVNTSVQQDFEAIWQSLSYPIADFAAVWNVSGVAVSSVLTLRPHRTDITLRPVRAGITLG